MVDLEEEIIDKDFRQSYWLALQFWVQPNRIFTVGEPQASHGIRTNKRLPRRRSFLEYASNRNLSLLHLFAFSYYYLLHTTLSVENGEYLVSAHYQGPKINKYGNYVHSHITGTQNVNTTPFCAGNQALVPEYQVWTAPYKSFPLWAILGSAHSGANSHPFTLVLTILQSHRSTTVTETFLTLYPHTNFPL